MAVTQKNREIEIFSPLGDDILLLRNMTASEELGRISTIDLDILSTQNIEFEDLLGHNITIRLNLADEKYRYFNGYVCNISQSVHEGRYACYSAKVVPWLWFLTRTSDCRIFQNKTVPEIIKEIFGEFDFAHVEDKLHGTYRKWDYCVQYRETDFNFVSRLMENEGIYYYFIHEQGKHTLYLADDYGSHKIIADYEQIPYYPPDDVAVREEECINAWYFTKHLQPGAYVLNDYDFTRPKADLKVNSKVAREHKEAQHEIYDYPGVYVKADDGESYARTRIQELHAQFERAQGQSNCRGLICGGLFSLTEFARADQNREYLVTSINHSISVDSFEAGTSGKGAAYTNSFTAIESNTPYRSARITPKPTVQGPQTAVVVGPAEEEIHTDKYGRVKLQFHWDRYGKKDENSSCWVRVSHPWAGKGWGAISVPRIGQEVIVDFLEGDPDQPIVTGRVYNADVMPPFGLPAAAVVSGIKSNTHKGKGYNEMSMDDTAGKEKITIHGQYDMNTTVEHDRNTTIVGGNDTLTVQAGTRTVTVKGDTTLTVQAGNYIAAASLAISLHGQGKGVSVLGDVEGVGITGNGKGVGIIGNGQGVGIEGNGKGVGITGNDEGVGIIGNGKGVSVEGTPDVYLDGKSNVTIKSPLVDIGDQEIEIHGTKITLSAGSGSIVIDASGVSIKGALVKIN